jgi:hypothetical protein
MGLAGCSVSPTGEVIDTVPASGQLTYKGKPLEYHQVILMADGKRPALGISDAEGKFTLGTNTANDGAAPGTYQVAVSYVGPPNKNPEAGMTDFSAPPPPKVKIPAKYADSTKSGISVEIKSSGTTDLKVDLN